MIENKTSFENLVKTELLTKVGHWEWIINQDKVIWSPGLLKIYEIENEEVPLKINEFDKFIVADDIDYFSKTFNLAIEKREKSNLDYRIKTKVGLKDIYSEMFPLFEEDEFIGFFGSVQDVTRLKKNERELRQINEKLEKSNQDLEKFAYITSHDLKAPLRGIINLKDFIEEDLAPYFKSNIKGQDEIRSHLDRLGRQTRRMESLIQGILEYSKLDTATYSLSKVNTKELIKTIATEQEVFDKLFLKSELPIFNTDEIRLGQVLSNLISNAKKYHPNQANLEINIDVKDEENFYLFSVSDNGNGIDKKFHEKIFGMFQTLQPKDKFESTGIGLTLVKRIVDLLGGKIWIISEKGSGATFLFKWPKTINT